MSDAPDLSPEDAMERYLNQRQTETSDETIRGYRYRLRQFVQWAADNGVERMSALDGWMLDQYENYRRGEGLAPATLTSEMQTLRQWLEYLARIDVVGDDLPEKVHVPTIPDGEESNDEMLSHSVAEQLIGMFRSHPTRRASTNHVLLELLWYTGSRLGSIRSLDVDDYHSSEEFVEFHHRPQTDTPLKNATDGERAVGLPPEVCDVVDEYLRQHRTEAYDNAGRAPLITSTKGRPSQNTIRVWCYLATQPCLYRECPHGHERDSCEFLTVHDASKCPSSMSPHRVRTGSITWQLDSGIPPEIVSERVNATLEVIESHYDKATKRERLERRRRPYIQNLQFSEP